VPDYYEPDQFYLSERDVTRLIGATKSLRDRVAVELLYYCALRRAEVRSLDVVHIDFTRCTLYVHGKAKPRAKGVEGPAKPVTAPVPVPGFVVRNIRYLVRDARGRVRSGPLLVGSRGPKSRIAAETISNIVYRAGEAAHVTHPNPKRTRINPHLLRHSFGRHFLARGGDLVTLQRILRHSTIVTTAKVYGQPTFEDVCTRYADVVSNLLAATVEDEENDEEL